MTASNLIDTEEYNERVIVRAPVKDTTISDYQAIMIVGSPITLAENGSVGAEEFCWMVSCHNLLFFMALIAFAYKII